MTLRYKLRTLLILLAVLPPVLWVGWEKYQVWRGGQERRRVVEAARARLRNPGGLITWEYDLLQKFVNDPAMPIQQGDLDVRELARPPTTQNPQRPLVHLIDYNQSSGAESTLPLNVRLEDSQ